MDDLKLNPRLPSSVRDAVRRLGLASLWEGASPMPGGRGSARLLHLEGGAFVVKQERRGGQLSAVVPDRFLLRRPFLDEWALGLHLAEKGLAPEPAALQMTGPRLGFLVFSMAVAALPSRSLAELWREGGLDGPALARIGEAVASLHRAGVIHGDLNAGNLLFAEAPLALLLDLRHSSLTLSPPPPAARRHNLLRLCRSLHKLQILHSLEWPGGPWEALLSGYSRGWGAEENWYPAFLSAAERGFPVRSFFW